MTKMQRLEERIRRDDTMCAEINTLLDTHGWSSKDMAMTLGAIMSCLASAGRREATPWMPKTRAS
jgi:hypothetical protein